MDAYVTAQKRLFERQTHGGIARKLGSLAVHTVVNYRSSEKDASAVVGDKWWPAPLTGAVTSSAGLLRVVVPAN